MDESKILGVIIVVSSKDPFQISYRGYIGDSPAQLASFNDEATKLIDIRRVVKAKSPI